MKKTIPLILIALTTIAPGLAHADAEGCIRETLKAASDCVKGDNKDCKAGIDKAIDACTKGK